MGDVMFDEPEVRCMTGWWFEMGGNPKIGVKPPKWMVKIMENPYQNG